MIRNLILKALAYIVVKALEYDYDRNGATRVLIESGSQTHEHDLSQVARFHQE